MNKRHAQKQCDIYNMTVDSQNNRKLIWAFIPYLLYKTNTLTYSLLLKRLLISWLQVTVHSDFGAQENIVCYCFHCFPMICREVMGPDAKILDFWMLSFKPTFSLSSSTFTKGLYSSYSLSDVKVVSYGRKGN